MNTTVFVDHSGDIFYPRGLLKGPRANLHRGQSNHLVLVGMAFTPPQLEKWSQFCNGLIKTYLPNANPAEVEIHATEMNGRDRKNAWLGVSSHLMPAINDELTKGLLGSGAKASAHIFHKQRYWDHFQYIAPEDPGPNAVRHLFKRLDKAYSAAGSRFDVVFDEDADVVRKAYSGAILNVKATGDSLDPGTPSISHLSALGEVSWLDSRLSRGIQAADFVAYWTFKAVEHGLANRIRSMDGIWRKVGYSGREPWYFPYKDPESNEQYPEYRRLRGAHTIQPYSGPAGR